MFHQLPHELFQIIVQFVGYEQSIAVKLMQYIHVDLAMNTLYPSSRHMINALLPVGFHHAMVTRDLVLFHQLMGDPVTNDHRIRELSRYQGWMDHTWVEMWI